MSGKIKCIIKNQGKSYPTSKAQGEHQQLWCVSITLPIKASTEALEVIQSN